MISILKAIYPSTLTLWDSKEAPAGYIELVQDDFLALDLAESHGILSVLPGIYYECCRYPIASLFQSSMNIAAKENCITADTTYRHDWCPDMHSFLSDAPDKCTGAGDCDTERLRYLEVHGLPKFEDVFFKGFDWDNIELCVFCAESGKEEYSDQRARLWNALPSLFGLMPWKDLLKAC